MKILVVSNLYPPTVIGGYEISCAQMVEALIARGHQVRVLTSIPDRLVDGPDYVTRTMRHPDSFSTERPRARSEFWEVEANLIDSGNVWVLASALEEFRPDVCYLWNLIGLGGVALVGCLEYLGVPWVWHLGDAVPAYLCIFDGRILPVAREMSQRLTGRFLAVSQGLVNEIEHVVDMGGRVRIVPNWVLHSGPPPDRQYFAGGTLRLIFAGRIAQEKGVYILIRALALLREQGIENFALDMVGTGEVDQVRSEVEGLGLGDHVSIKGWMPQAELRRELRAHDVFAFPTFAKDAFPIAPLEAAAEGCVPLLSTPSGSSEWMIDGVDCLKARRDPESFANAIGVICRGQVGLAAIGRRAAAVVRRDFVLPRVVPIVEEELRAAGRERRPALGSGDSVYKMAIIAEAMVRSAVRTGSDPQGAAP